MLRPLPHRGDVVAAGAVALAALVALVQLRFDHVWAHGVHLVYAQIVPVELFGPGAGAGWELFLYACGFGLCAYAAVDRVPGPGWIGVATLAVTTLVAAGGKATLIGWPLVLGAGAGSLLFVGLRPSRPLPPAPGDGEVAEVFEIRIER